MGITSSFKSFLSFISVILYPEDWTSGKERSKGGNINAYIIPEKDYSPHKKWLVCHVKLRTFILCLHITCNGTDESLEKQSNPRTTELFPWYQWDSMKVWISFSNLALAKELCGALLPLPVHFCQLKNDRYTDLWEMGNGVPLGF